MVIRTALGALAAVAVIGGLAAALPERESKQTAANAAPPYGGLTKPEFEPAKPSETSTAPAGVPASLISPVAYPLQDHSAGSPVAPKPPDATRDVTRTPALVAAPPAGDPPVATTTPPETSVASIQQPSAAASQASVMTEPAPVEPATSHLINLNTAAASDFDKIGGVGRIGRSIVRRRPYRSVDDLLRKRVLRAGAFQRIRGLVTVD